MDTSLELTRAALDWRNAAQRVIEAARQAAPLSVRTLDAGVHPTESEPEAAVSAFLDASERIVAQLPNFTELESYFEPAEPLGDGTPARDVPESSEALRARIEAEEWVEPSDRVVDRTEGARDSIDLDAANRALALYTGSLLMVDALLGAAESPNTIRAEFGVEDLFEFGGSTLSAIEGFADVINGGPAAVGADPIATMPGELHRLGDAAGSETVALATFGIGGRELPDLVSALGDLAGASRDGAQAIHELLQLNGLLNRLKREAARILQWLLNRVSRLLPPGTQKLVEQLSQDRTFDLFRPARIVGEVEVDIFGARMLIARWNALTPDMRPSVPDTLIEPSLEHIRWISQGRRAVGRVSLVFVHLNPQLAVAYYGTVAMAIAFVVAQAGFGVRALRATMNAA